MTIPHHSITQFANFLIAKLPNCRIADLSNYTAIALCLALATTAQAQITVLNSGGAASTTTSTVATSAISTSGASLVVVSIQYFPNSGGTNLPVFTDNQSNTWTLKRQKTNSYQGSDVYYCYPCTVSATHTFTASCSACNPSISVLAVAGTLTTAIPFDQSNGSSSASFTTTITPGSVTPTQANEIAIAAVTTSSAAPGTAPSGYTYGYTCSGGSTAFGGGLAYQVQTTAVATSPVFTLSSANTAAANILTFFKGASTAKSYTSFKLLVR